MRNYQKETEWSKEKYSRIEVRIDKKLGEKLKDKLRKDNKSIASWISENAEKYIKD